LFVYQGVSMTGTRLIPVLAILVAVSGVVRHDASAHTALRIKSAVVAAADSSPWQCNNIREFRDEVARRIANSGLKQLSMCGVSDFDCPMMPTSVSFCVSAREPSAQLTLLRLRIKLQV
jgi:hypothetical protein